MIVHHFCTAHRSRAGMHQNWLQFMGPVGPQQIPGTYFRSVQQRFG